MDSTHEFDALQRDRDLEPIIQRFEEAWLADERPDIEVYLSDCRAPDQPALLGSLLEIEIELRVESGETPDSAEYTKRFPEHSSVVERVCRTRLAALNETRITIQCPECSSDRTTELTDSHGTRTCVTCDHTFRLVPTAPTSLLQPGSRIAQFELERHIGQGGFGSVWQANDTTLDRKVAIKVPRRDVMSSQESDQLYRDARAAARLSHPGIVKVHEVGRFEDTVYVVSELVDGNTLTDWATDKRLSATEASKLCLSMAEALQHAHDAGIIHRDLKPSNVMMDEAGAPHLIDFGLAVNQNVETTISEDGGILGTPAYMSPEQASGNAGQADARTDVYSLGVVLFELLTGQRPFRGEFSALLTAVISQEPPAPASLRPNIPADIETVCLKCLEKTPEARYQSAADLADDLSRFINGEPVRARPISKLNRAWRWCRKNRLIASLSTVLAMLLLGLSIGGPIVAMQQTTLAKSEATAREKAVESGKQLEVAYRKTEKARQNEAAERSRAERETAKAQRQIARLRVMQGTRAMAEGDLLEAIQWMESAQSADKAANATAASATDEYVAKEHSMRLAWLREAAPRSSQAWHQPSQGVSTSRFNRLHCASDQQVAIWSGNDNLLHTLDLTTGDYLGSPLAHDRLLRDSTVSPDGSLAATLDSSGDIRIANTRSGKLIGSPLRVEGTRRVIFTSDDELFLGGNEGIQFVQINRSTSGQPTTKTAELAYKQASVQFDIAANGQRCAVFARSDSGQAFVYVWDRETGLVGRVNVESQGKPASVALNADGKTVAALVKGEPVVFVDVSTGSVTKTLDDRVGDVRHGEFNSDGTLFLACGQKGAQIFNVESGQPVGTQIHRGDLVFFARFSPSGKVVATASRDHTARVWDTQTGKPLCPPIHHADNVWDVRFAGDDETILTCSRDGRATLWNWPSSHSLNVLKLHKGPVRRVIYAGNDLVSCGDDGRICFGASRADPQVETQDGPIKQLVASMSRRTFVSIAEGAPAKVWRVRRTGNANPVGGFRSNREATVAISDDGKTVAYSKGNRISIRSLESGAFVIRNQNVRNAAAIRALDFSSDGTIVLVAAEGRTKGLDANTGETVFVLDDPRAVKTHAMFGPRGEFVFTSGRQGHNHMSLRKDGQTLAQWEDTTPRLISAEFSNDGSMLLTGHVDGSFRLRDVATGELRFPPANHEGLAVTRLSPDGKSIYSAGADSSVRLWSAISGEPLSPALKHKAVINDVAIHADGTQFASACEDGTVQVWTHPQRK